ncbi:amino acid adenylation domain-containing protein [Actinoplanes oblitus]|uniref:Amino acid adenylation domain-containing protein n=1 Tax=Actinoplanes oblitus TaxID=3040509 RepID=A0ABY8WSX1_9ACTN|nr:non-ribosomal peptide synthetase [Actinoplanes oblitus]WIN00204.1 amino acid adenylation domain-containing protein [Actinoplanes oblitus]
MSDPSTGVRPLNAAQRGVWYAQRIDPGNPVHNMAGYLEIRGPVDVAALSAAVTALVREDETARLRFTEADGAPAQYLAAAAEFIPEIHDVSGEPDPHAAALRIMRADLDRPVDLEHDRLFTYQIHRLGPEHFLWYGRAHHLILDGYSATIQRRRTAELYTALVTGADVGTPLGSFTAVLDEQERYARSPARQRDAAYWRRSMADAVPPAPRGRPEHRVVRRVTRVDEEGLARLRGFADRAGVTWQQALIAVTVLHRRVWTGNDHVVLGLPLPGRLDAHAIRTPGMTANVMPLSCRVDPAESTAQLAARVAREALRAQWHQRYDAADLRRDLGWTADQGRDFGPMINFVLGDEHDDFAGLPALYHLLSTGGTVADVALTVTHHPEGGLRIDVSTDTAYEKALDLDAYQRTFHRVLADVTGRPDAPVAEIGALDTAERDLVLRDWNDTVVPVDDMSLPAMFAARVAADPGAPAIHGDGVTLTYAELDTAANRLANHLLANGVRRGDIVGVLLPRGIDFAVAVLAVTKTGAAYTLLDPDFPNARLTRVLTDTRATALITNDTLAGRTTVDCPVICETGDNPEDPGIHVDPGDAACVMFTSGSSGTPKGVLSPHRALTGTLTGQTYTDFGPGQVFLQCSPVSWDAFSLEFWGALAFGGLCVLQPGQRPEPTLIASLVRDHAVTMLQLSSGLFNLLADEYPHAFDGVHTAFTGGEVSSPSHVQQALRHHPHLHVANAYGPAESMGFSTTFPIPNGYPDTTLPIGRPIANKRIYLLDNALRPVPIGVVGEVYLAGIGLAHGYLGQPATTATRFIANPYHPTDRLYRTGDLARWTPDGQLTFTGRADHQVKIRGFRIEPAEIETALLQHPDITQAAVLATPDHLTGYIVGTTDPTTTRTWLRQHLPDHMIPTTITILDRLPLTPNGKLDRRALPQPDPSSAAGTGRSARDAREEILCGLYAEVLGVAEVGVDDDFFDLGGHSLLAARLAARARGILGTELSIRDVFQAPTVAALAASLSDAGRAGVRPAPVAGPRGEHLPLSYAQRRLWLTDAVQGPGTTYNVPMAIPLHGRLDVGALTAALTDLTTRHQVLRTVIGTVGDEPCQRILAPEPVDVDHIPATAGDLDELLTAAAGHVFDLAAERPLRVTLFDLGDDEYVLLLLLHHIATDGQSLRPLLDDLATAYAARCAGAAPGWAPLPVQYADYTLWQRDLLGDPADPDSRHATDLRYWTTNLNGLPDEIGLPLDRPRPATADHRGAAVPVRVEPALADRIRVVAREQRCTPFMVVQAALALTLSRFGAGTDVALGTPVAGRTDPALDPLVGFFVNTLVLRTDVSGDPSFGELLARVRRADLDALAHQELPFDQLLEALQPVRSLARHPLFQVCLGFDDATDAELRLPGLRAGRGRVVATGETKFDLEFLLRDEGADGIGGGLLYRTALFDRSTAERLLAGLVRTLTQVLADPDQPISAVDVLTPTERAAVVQDWNDTVVPVDDMSLPAMFAARVAADPGAPAIHGDGVTLTYAELDTAANRLANHLLANGVRRGDIVGILLPRGIDFAVAVLAVTKTGAAYTLLDPDFPNARLTRVLTDTKATALITNDTLAGRTTVDCPVICETGDNPEDPGIHVDPGDAACVMFTSGSSGTPKGVLSPHRALTGTLTGQTYTDFGPGQVFLQCSPVSWDAFSLEFWGALAFGGLCVLQPGQRPEPTLIASLVRDHAVTMLQLSSGLFNLLADEYPHAFDGVHTAFTGGEVSSPSHVQQALRHHPHLHVANAYGPAESMGFSTTFPIPNGYPDTTLPIGRPIANKRIYLLDNALRPVPIGVVGEVYLAGIGLAHGYLGQPATTATRFIANPYHPTDRLYRTGDLARWTPDGQLTFTGRADHQVKIRGFRIEPAEIETALLQHPDITQAAVLATPDHLTGYIVGTTDPTTTRTWLRQHLPDHMIPTTITILDRLPLTPNGKLDRRALPQPDPSSAAGTGRSARDAREEILCGLYAEILGLPTISIDDDFFDLGGHSLLAARLTARIRAALGAELSIRDIFQAPTVAALTERLPAAAPARARPALRRRTDAGVPLPS